MNEPLREKVAHVNGLFEEAASTPLESTTKSIVSARLLQLLLSKGTSIKISDYESLKEEIIQTLRPYLRPID